MVENLSVVRDRLSSYVFRPDRQFRTDSGYTAEEESVTQKLRQYWADEKIPNSVKLQDFDFDLSNFDPRNTSYRELRDISYALMELGIIDESTWGFSGAGSEFNNQGNQINMDKKVDVFEHLNRSLKFIKGYIAEGHDFAKGTLIQLNLNITVMLALQERAQTSRSNALVDIKA